MTERDRQVWRLRQHADPGRTCLRAFCVGVGASLLVACGSSAPKAADPNDSSSLPATPLPLVDLSQRPVADDPDPAVRAGAAANFIECEFGVSQGGWSLDFGPLGGGSDPDGAITDMIDRGVVGLPGGGFAAVGRDRDRVLYTYDVAGSPKAAVVVAESTKASLDTDDAWGVETFASCDPAEFEPSADELLPMNVWQDAGGRRVPTSVITSAQGAEHCGWESATFLFLDGEGYVSDPERVLDASGFVAPFDADGELPSNAIDTGYQQQGRQLWLSQDRTIAFIVAGGVVEAWPSSTTEFVCA